jgi:DNA-binding LacI/PurR family transcriptional regulator
MMKGLGDKVQLDLFIYHCDYELFSKLLLERLEGYSYYVIMPHFKECDMNEYRGMMKKIPMEKIIVIDNQIEGYEHYLSCIYQDFKMDLYDALVEAKDDLDRYNRLILVFPQNQDYPLPKEIILGFRRYCGFNNIHNEIINKISPDYEIKQGAAYIVMDDHDLVNLIKIQRAKGYELKKDIGILSYNDTAMKEVLANGISTISTDFQMMGRMAAQSILKNEAIEMKNDFNLVMRQSL